MAINLHQQRERLSARAASFIFLFFAELLGFIHKCKRCPVHHESVSPIHTQLGRWKSQEALMCADSHQKCRNTGGMVIAVFVETIRIYYE